MGQPLDVSAPDPVVACYIDQNYASLLLLLAKYSDFTAAVLANATRAARMSTAASCSAHCSVHRAGASGIPSELKAGLRHRAAIEAEIDAFVAARVGGGTSAKASSCSP